MIRGPKAWWVCASTKKHGGGWHWDNFLKRPNSRRQALKWGGREWINSPASFNRIQNMKRGDYIVAYQAGEGILGIARLQSDGYRSRRFGKFDMFDLKPGFVFRFEEAVPLSVVRSLPNACDTFEFVRSLRGTVFEIEPGGFERIVFLGAGFNPQLASRILKLVL